MSESLSDVVLPVPALRRPHRRQRSRAKRSPVGAIPEPRARPARTPDVLTLSARRIVRADLSEDAVPYLRMSGRWLEEHGFAIGAGVQVLVEQGRVTIISSGSGVSDGIEVPGSQPRGPRE